MPPLQEALAPRAGCNVSIRPMRAEDIPAVSAFADGVWRAHYTPIIAPGDLAYMMALFNAPESLARQMQEATFLLAFHDEALAGFTSFSWTARGHMRVHKFYIDATRHRRGLGARLMTHLTAEYWPRRMELCVYRKNIAAINFYFKMGFTIAQTRLTDIGQGVFMDDFQMVKSC